MVCVVVDKNIIYKAAMTWYGNTELDSSCLAENRLLRGETFNEKKYSWKCSKSDHVWFSFFLVCGFGT